MSTTEVDEKQELALKRAKWLDSAREMIRFLETKPELIDDLGRIHLTSYVYGHGKDEEAKQKDAKRQTRRIVRAFGKCQKNWLSWALEIKKEFGPHEITVSVSREAICERKVVGTKHVPEFRVAAHQEDIVEWVCEDPSILRAVK